MSFWSSRSPHGERGLKFTTPYTRFVLSVSLPAWGAWIEMPRAPRPPDRKPCRSPHGERGLKSSKKVPLDETSASLPAWGAWIEISVLQDDGTIDLVAPRMGSVD